MKNQMLSILLTISFLGLTACDSNAKKAPADDSIGTRESGERMTGVTVSGVSSGAFMAVQLGVAYSSEVAGVAAVAGGIYDCAEGSAERATDLCMKTPEKIDVAKSVQSVRERLANGTIDDPSAIANQKIFILNGMKDETVRPESGKKLAEFYRSLGANPVVEFKLEMGHGFPAISGKNDCASSGLPWTNNCQYDGAQKILETLYGRLNPRAEVVQAKVTEFSQAAAPNTAMLAEKGHIFVPASCKGEGSACRVHVAFHGCLQAPSFVQRAFVEDAGFNNWAETNKIVVIYPAVRLGFANPNGCWDWYGYTGENAATQQGSQMKALHHLIQKKSKRFLPAR